NVISASSRTTATASSGVVSLARYSASFGPGRTRTWWQRQCRKSRDARLDADRRPEQHRRAAGDVARLVVALSGNHRLPSSRSASRAEGGGDHSANPERAVEEPVPRVPHDFDP